MDDTNYRIEMMLPAEMAKKAEQLGVKKATIGWRNLLLLSIMAGAFIALGAIFSTTVTSGAALTIPFGISKLLGGLVFCLGLILVVVGGAELFTGNNLIIMALASGKITLRQLLRNWIIVYTGNFIGSFLTAIIMFFTRQFMFGKSVIGLNALNIAAAKCNIGFMEAIFLGIMCNALVCLAVWLCFSAKSTTDKILSIIFPITAFVACGFEHSVANMYFIPIGIFIKSFAQPLFWENIGKTAGDYVTLTWTNFFIANLLPVTIGNIIGGSVLVGLTYWFVYIRKPRVPIF
ncbi:formate/nitrite transporter family protein [Desulfobacterium sp. N47]|uniref:Probable formate transporter 1 n=1 Tax=uncultured Desulfobacterium sp. TaxID=201089 RepID=E1YAH5_9BACT|nr:Probable formate transporter 1 [uncultured Desulfobacterium sp.]